MENSEIQHTFEMDTVKNACLDLISQNADHLISYVYSNLDKPPYNNKVIRVGLALKTLLRSSDSSDSVLVKTETINPVIMDLSDLIKKAPSELERKILVDELTFLQRCTQLDELVTLNTVHANGNGASYYTE